jgi:hypothetical protein
MHVIFLNFTKKADSTATPTSEQLAAGISFDSVVLKELTNIDNPVLKIDQGSSEIYKMNYCYIQEWNRYYFVQTVNLRHDTIFECNLTLDDLASFKTSILAYTAFVERCASPTYYNSDIPDGALSVEDMIDHVSSASTDVGFSSALLYVVRILGRGSTGGVGTFLTNLASMQNIFSQMWADIDDGMGLGDLEEFMQMWIADPIKYLIGVYSTPIGGSVYYHNLSPETVFFGGHETNITWDKITAGETVMFSGALNKPTSIYTDFRRTDPAFSSYTIYIPTVGTVPLASDLIERNLTMEIGADLWTGDLLFKLKADGELVGTYNSNCYASQSIGVVNQANGIMSGSLATAASLTTGNVAGIIEGIKTAMSPTPSIVGSQGGTGCVTVANNIVITCCQKSSADFPVSVYGRPCCKNIALSNLSGYVKCANSSIALAANKSVIESVNAKLDAGIYIE